MAEQPNIADEQLSEGHHVEPSTKFEPRVMDAEKMLQCICGSGKLSSSEDDGNLISCEKCKTRQHTVCYYPDQENETLGEDFHHICFDCAHHTSFEDATDTTDDEEEDESVDEYTSGFSEASASASQFGEASTDGNNMPNVFFYMTQDVQYAPATGEQSLPSTPSGGAYNSTDDTLQISSINQAAQEFREQFFALSQIPSRWEDPKRLDEALETIPLDLIHEQAQKAEEEAVLKRAQNLDLNKEKQDPDEWGHSDFIIMALLQWFKQDFFKWETNSVCPVCSSPTKAQGETEPTAQEREDSALVVELYMCCNQECGASERFPRYSDPFRLLGTKRGRLAEWANCFGMLCRAVEARVRWVWNADKGHIWLEVFSEAKTRWVSIDVFEAAWDQPLLYTEVWGEKMSYCIAFSADGPTDVTRRYVRGAGYQLPRRWCSEAELEDIILELRELRRADMDKLRKAVLEEADNVEEMELLGYVTGGSLEDEEEMRGRAAFKSSSPIPDPQPGLSVDKGKGIAVS